MYNITSDIGCDSTDSPDNNDEIPILLHIPTTFITLIVFLVSIQQLCSASMGISVIKYRAGVVCSCFTLLILSICLDFDIESSNGTILLNPSFAYVVRTIMVLWLFILFILGYFLIQHVLKVAYKSSKSNRKEPPPWILKFWVVIICSEEFILLLCYVFAFALKKILPLKILWVSAYFVAIIGCIICCGALLDVELAIRNAIKKTKQNHKHIEYSTTSTNNNNKNIPIPSNSQQNDKIKEDHNKKIKDGQRIIITIMVLSFIIAICCIYSITLLVISIINTKCFYDPVNTLMTTSLDNPRDYIVYMYTLIFGDIAFIFWTYRPESINYCFYCCMYKRYTTQNHIKNKTKIDKTVLCYLCCSGMIDKAENNRINVIKQLQLKSHQIQNDKSASTV